MSLIGSVRLTGLRWSAVRLSLQTSRSGLSDEVQNLIMYVNVFNGNPNRGAGKTDEMIILHLCQDLRVTFVWESLSKLWKIPVFSSMLEDGFAGWH